jgi:hypothetical protein
VRDDVDVRHGADGLHEHGGQLHVRVRVGLHGARDGRRVYGRERVFDADDVRHGADGLHEHGGQLHVRVRVGLHRARGGRRLHRRERVRERRTLWRG